MRPALSVLLLTTLIGVGQGLFVALFAAESHAAFGLLPPVAPGFLAHGAFVAALLVAGGLAASFFHLGRPERAWRAAACWRTSWLSREVIVLPAFGGVVALYGLAHASAVNPVLGHLPSGAPIAASAVLGVAGVALALALFVCTGMIYACLRFLAEWHTPWTVVNFTVLGAASGFTCATAIAAATQPAIVDFLAGWALLLTLAGLATRGASLARNRRLRPRSTPQTAIGIKHPHVVQKAIGAIGGTFNTHEFFHGAPARRLAFVPWSFVLAAFVAPALLLALVLAGVGAPGLAAIALAIQYPGLLAERWFFFAQANHPQNLYYRCVS